jgi:excisionase family DNA binding protein
VAEIPRLFYTREEAAKAAGVSLDTVRRAINAGTLRAKRTGKEGGGKYLVSAEALRSWFEQLQDA